MLDFWLVILAAFAVGLFVGAIYVAVFLNLEERDSTVDRFFDDKFFDDTE